MGLGNKQRKKSAPTSTQSISGREFVGVEINDHAVKMVQVSGRSLDNLKVENFAMTPLPVGVINGGKVGNSKELVACLQQTASRMGNLAKNVIFGLPSVVSIVQSFDYDESSGLNLEQAAEFEISQISSVDELNFDFVVTEKTGKESKVLCAMSKKEDVEPFLAALEDANMSPALVDVETVAIANSFFWWINNNSTNLTNSIVVVCDIGEDVSQILLLSNGKVLFKQDFQFGGKRLTRDLQRECQLSADDAERMKKTTNKPQGYQVVADSFNEQVASEIQRALQFFYASGLYGSNDSKIERIFLTGGGCQVDGIEEAVSSTNGVLTQIVNPLGYAAVSSKVAQDQFKQNAARYTAAFGMALRGLV